MNEALEIIYWPRETAEITKTTIRDNIDNRRELYETA